MARLEKTYCNTMGVEYMHMNSRDKCNWIRRKVRLSFLLPVTPRKFVSCSVFADFMARLDLLYYWSRVPSFS